MAPSDLRDPVLVLLSSPTICRRALPCSNDVSGKTFNGNVPHPFYLVKTQKIPSARLSIPPPGLCSYFLKEFKLSEEPVFLKLKWDDSLFLLAFLTAFPSSRRCFHSAVLTQQLFNSMFPPQTHAPPLPRHITLIVAW